MQVSIQHKKILIEAQFCLILEQAKSEGFLTQTTIINSSDLSLNKRKNIILLADARTTDGNIKSHVK